MEPHAYRNDTDARLAGALAEHPALEPLIRARAQAEHAGLRRSLLAQALRLTPTVAPALFRTLDHCVERLSVQTEVELFVYASPQLNAACTAPEAGRVFVLLSSTLAENLADDELRFVVGHELGHHVFDHHAVPVGVLSDPRARVPAALAVQLRSWQRYAEISADRAGLVCCDGLAPAARSLFKISSGLLQTPRPDQVDAYLAQAAELYREAESTDAARAHRDWMATHPFSPVRLSAAKAFDAVRHDPSALEALELQVHGLMALMEPSYLDEDSDEAEHLRRFLFAAGVAVAGATAPVTPEELEALASLLGPKRVPARLDADAIVAEVEGRVERCRASVGPARRAAVLRDLALVALADGKVDLAERTLMLSLADRMNVDRGVVLDALEAPTELD